MTDIFDTATDNVNIEIPMNKIQKGEELNLTAWDQSVRTVSVGVGWDLMAFDGNPIDLDLSCFLLNKEEKTRVDSDFVFYNNPSGCNNAVNHQGDNRTGAGDGDDEIISMRLNDIPFDVLRLAFVISVYKGDEKEDYVSKVRNCYIRLFNAENGQEIVRYDLDPDFLNQKETAMIAATLDREGSKWFFRAVGRFVQGGLPKVAKMYDIIPQGG